MVTLVVPWYRPDSARHQSELFGALMSNLSAPGVDRVLLVSESEPAPPLSSPRLEFYSCKSRPTFWDLFELVRGQGHFCICNADCALRDLRGFERFTEKQILWLTRWEVIHGQPVAGHRYILGGGADLFGFSCVPDDLPRGHWSPGTMNCDRAIGNCATLYGFELKNLPWDFPMLHYHHERLQHNDYDDAPFMKDHCHFSVPVSIEHRSPLWQEPFRPHAP